MPRSLSHEHTRRDFLILAGTAVVAAVATKRVVAQTSQNKLTKPNILVVLADQWRRQALGCNGDDVVRTPNLDRFAKSAVSFQRCYSNNPVCTPARAAFQTSRYPHQTGMIGNSLYLPKEEICMAEVFQKAGYATGYIGKWHLDGSAKPGFVAPERRQGYTYFEGFNRGHYYGRQDAQWFTDDGQARRGDAFESKLQTDMAIGFMQQNSSKPFMLFLSWGPPHTPYVPPEEFDRYKPADLKWRANVPESYRSSSARQRDLCGYYGLIEALDAQFGRLMAYLDESGLAKNTIVLFTSDHGDCHGSHGLQYKTHPEEESLGVPMLIRTPNAAKTGKAVQTLASIIDFAPTLISLAGLTVPPSMEGHDLSPAVDGQNMASDFVYCEGKMAMGKKGAAGDDLDDGGKSDRREWRAIVTDRYKLVVSTNDDVTRLSDLKEDPFELKNLADDPSAKTIRHDLLAKLRSHAKETGDAFPKPSRSAPTAP